MSSYVDVCSYGSGGATTLADSEVIPRDTSYQFVDLPYVWLPGASITCPVRSRSASTYLSRYVGDLTIIMWTRLVLFATATKEL